MENSIPEFKHDENLLGYTSYNQEIALFDFGNVAVIKNYKEKDSVLLISGSLTSQVEYVGKGMLAASVQGCNSNTPPTPREILRVIKELSLDQLSGILLIVQETPDILSFALATERAVNDNLNVMMLVISEDKIAKKGSSGIILINKVAGAMCESGKSLLNVYEFCYQILGDIHSSSVNILNTAAKGECSYCENCLHRVNTKETVEQELRDLDMLKNIVDNITSNENVVFSPGDTVVILINNRIDRPRPQKYKFVKEIVNFFNTLDVHIARLYTGNYLPLNSGELLTFTILKLSNDEILSYLDFPCSAPGWQTVNQNLYLNLPNVIPGYLKRKFRLSPPIKGPKLRDRPTNVLQLCIQFACDAIISCEKMLNKMDSERGDGDMGTKLKNLADVLNKRIKEEKLIMNCPFSLFSSLSKILENIVGGSLGCTYGILFEGAANKFGQCQEEDEVTPLIWLEALENACDVAKRFTNVKSDDGTMYDPLFACADIVRANLTPNSKYITVFGLGVAKAEESAQNTRKLSYKYPDPAAHAVGIWMRAVYEGVKLRCSE